MMNLGYTLNTSWCRPQKKRQFPEKRTKTLQGTELELKFGSHRTLKECIDSFKALKELHGNNNRFYSVKKMWEYSKSIQPKPLSVDQLYQSNKENYPFGKDLQLSDFVKSLQNISISWDETIHINDVM